ncbi:Pseudomonas avirulence D protein (AvrD) [uncultured archaeon]|nr:Pseudomonas avirulence D protein (AvrD) [uncultured archaeon]
MLFGTKNLDKRIVISGTYSTGKTTTTRELSKLTGIPCAVARGMREILPETFPGKRLEECSPFELIQLGMVRFAERSILESRLKDSFISDGSALHEWAYGYGRILEGANGHGSEIFGNDYNFAMGAFGEVVKRHAAKNYTHIVHLPVEFPLNRDGHRPVSEDFRKKADDILIGTWDSLGIPFNVVTGSVEDRVTKIIDILGLDINTTVNGAEERPDGKLWYNSADDALGPSSGRYFSDGFRNTHHDIYDIEIDPKNGIINAKVDLRYGGQWSQKNGEGCKPHLSSIDSILIAGQLTQILMYAQDGISREESNNLWLRELGLKPGCKPIENVTAMPVYINITKSSKPRMCGKYWHAATVEGNIGDGAFRVNAKVGYELPTRLQENVGSSKVL